MKSKVLLGLASAALMLTACDLQKEAAAANDVVGEGSVK